MPAVPNARGRSSTRTSAGAIVGCEAWQIEPATSGAAERARGCTAAAAYRPEHVAFGRWNWRDRLMEAVMAAIRTGDYGRAYDALQHTAEAGTTIGVAVGAFLLALT